MFFTFGATLFFGALISQILAHVSAGLIVLLVVPGALVLAAALAHLVTVLVVSRYVRPRQR